jgi:nucleoside-diphosphate-sugar epimerase
MTVLSQDTLPDRLEDEAAVEELLSRPSQDLIDDLARLDGDILVLGVGGKVGPTLARLAKRAAPNKRVVGVARFTDPAVRARLDEWGVETIACDLLDREAVIALPKLENVVYMAGRKFGTSGDEPFTWAMNVEAPAITAAAFPTARIVAFSTLCVYPFTPVVECGALETTRPDPPGEYASSCLGRERIFQHYANKTGTSGRLIRLAYAIDMRYGVLHEIATKVHDGTLIDLTTGHTSIIWQGDASSQILRSLMHCTAPTTPLNITAPDIVRVRSLAEELGKRLGKTPVFAGTEAEAAWVMNGAEALGLFGAPLVGTDKMLDWTADWVARAKPSYGKPTHYDSRDGQF